MFHFSKQMKIFIGNKWREISIAELVPFPSFVRPDTVTLSCDCGFQSIEEKCQSFVSHLLTLKPELNESIRICFHARILQNNSRFFRDQSQLLEYLRKQLLPFCNSSHGFCFVIEFTSDSDEDKATNVIESILKIPRIDDCFNVEISTRCALFLPVDAVAKWLNRNSDMIGRKKEMFLKIDSVHNAVEACDYLAQVHFIILI